MAEESPNDPAGASLEEKEPNNRPVPESRWEETFTGQDRGREREGGRKKRVGEGLMGWWTAVN